MPDPSRSGEEVETLRDYRDIELWKDVTEAQWNDWRWQVANRITTVEVLRGVIPLSDTEAREIQESLGALRMAITPYYASLIDPKDPEDPVRRQAVPSILETHVAETDLRDPLHEDVDSPVPGLAHRYPDRGILLRLIPDPDAVVRRFGAEFEKLLYLAMMGPWDAPLDAAAAEALLQDATVA